MPPVVREGHPRAFESNTRGREATRSPSEIPRDHGVDLAGPDPLAHQLILVSVVIESTGPGTFVSCGL